jgi:hypothetical protein
MGVMTSRTEPGSNESGAVVRVGKGRGFVMEGSRGRVIITAAHCLPKFPICATHSFEEERTYRSLLGPLGKKAVVSAVCMFADPIGDIAVLGPPDDQVFAAQADDFAALVSETFPLTASKVEVSEGNAPVPGWLLSLDGPWFPCKVTSDANGRLWTSEATNGIRGGMSGSPILSDSGSAIGVATSGDEDSTDGGPCPQLISNLPGWLLRELGLLRAKGRAGGGRAKKRAAGD